MYRFFLASVITEHPFGCFRIEDSFQCELAQACLNITRSRSAITSKDISPVSLTINQQVFLPELNECIANRSITMRVILHGLSNDIGHFVHFTVINTLHCMQDTALNGFKTIFYRRDGTFKNDIRSIVQEPILVHACQMIFNLIFCHYSPRLLRKI